MTPRVFTISPGAPFLASFARALLDGEIVPGLSREAGPLALAKTTIYVPTRRAGRALATELARHSGRDAALLPKILPLGALDGDSGEAGFDNPLDPDLPRAAGDIERRMLLGELILAWAKNLKNAIISIDADGNVTQAPETMLVATRPADAWRLSGELAALIDEMIIEGVAWKGIEALGGDYDDYWRITLQFLDIAIKVWPAMQQEGGFVDAAARQQALIARAVARVAETPDPVIALGSTGSNIATAQLLAAIARAPRGAVVLPGLDRDLDALSFALLRASDEPIATHPQAFLARLIETLALKREAVQPLGAPTPILRAREKFISEAFRPADTTDLWTAWRAQAPDIEPPLRDVSLIEAADEREEALSIALCLRAALEEPDKTAALVTPDRALAERVRAELLRWDVQIDDSGGAPLAAAPAGVLARLILLALSEEAGDCAALLAHREATLGLGAEGRRLAPLFELGVLRSGAKETLWRDRVAPERKAAQDKYAHPRQKEIGETDWRALEAFAEKLDTALAPLRALNGAEQPLKPWLAALRAALGCIVAGDPAQIPGGADGEALAALFDELEQAANATFQFHAESFAAFFDALIGERVVRGAADAHPRLKILGLLEARLIHADLLVLGGLDETVWPPQGASDSFLNRPMRAQLGLSSPDRRLGQTAHDFCQAFGAPEVVLTRAKKRGGAPTTPSRFLQRMEALAGAENFAPLRARGGQWLAWARTIDETLNKPKPLRRPAPCPELALRPDRLSVTQIETLRRDPYAVYAEHVLKLKALPGLDEDLGASEIGQALHAALEDFCRAFPSGPLPGDAREKLVALAREKLAAFSGDPEFESFRWPRLLRGLDAFLAYEAQRRPEIDRILVEAKGALVLTLDDGSIFTLTGRADRIELLKSGGAALVDYKSGEIPSNSQVAAGFAPQLTLEGAMLKEGGFADVGPRKAETAFYVPIGGAQDKAREVRDKETSFPELVAEHEKELRDLLNQFRDPKQTYPARPFPQFAKKYNDYDHLARTREWAASGEDDE